MEGGRRGARVLALALALSVWLWQPAAADDRGDDVRAFTDGNGVDVVFVHNEDGSATGQPQSGSGSCTWSAMPVDPIALGESTKVPPPPSEDAHLYALYCDDEYRGLAWLGPSDFAAAPTEPVVQELVRRIEVLPAQLAVRPDTRGVTGIPSLFWVEGYDGEPISESLTAFGMTVRVQATMTDVVWDFGDGTPPVHGGLGEAWPDRSSVQHTYADPSTGAGHPVTVIVTLQPSFSVNGGAPAPLAPIVLTFTRPYVVREVQAVRNS
jgi:hypothetical protein